MGLDSSTPVTRLLQSASSDEGAREQLFEILYDELRRVARGQLAGSPPQATLHATALVNEAYLKLVGKAAPPAWENRRHFFFAAARAMRDVLVDEARRKCAKRRGGEWKRANLQDLELSLATPADELLALDDALGVLEEEDPRRADIVRLRFFGGLSEDETASALGVSKRTVSREWAVARARLALILKPSVD